MAFKTWEVQHSFQSFASADAAERFVNVWHIYNETDMTDLSTGIPANIASAFHQFYEDVNNDSYYSNVVQGSGRTVKFYDVTTDGPPASQFTSTAGPFLTGIHENGSLPQEVSVCLSFEGFLYTPEHAVGTTGARARRRGRVYLGPLSESTNQGNETNWVSHANIPFITVVLGAFETLVDELLGLGTTLGIWSKTDALFTAVKTAWIDDAWDTQRRRGAAPSVRVANTRTSDGTAWES